MRLFKRSSKLMKTVVTHRPYAVYGDTEKLLEEMAEALDCVTDLIGTPSDKLTMEDNKDIVAAIRVLSNYRGRK